MNIPPDYYKLLEIDAGASQAEIKKAYRAQALRYHPDINSDEEAAEHIKSVNQAYAVLSDPEKRLFYDRTGAAPGRQSRSQAWPAGPGFGGCWGRGMGRGMGCGRRRMWQEMLRKR